MLCFGSVLQPHNTPSFSPWFSVCRAVCVCVLCVCVLLGVCCVWKLDGSPRTPLCLSVNFTPRFPVVFVALCAVSALSGPFAFWGVLCAYIEQKNGLKCACVDERDDGATVAAPAAAASKQASKQQQQLYVC